MTWRCSEGFRLLQTVNPQSAFFLVLEIVFIEGLQLPNILLLTLNILNMLGSVSRESTLLTDLPV
jgi:hypothetical protein